MKKLAIALGSLALLASGVQSAEPAKQVAAAPAARPPVTTTAASTGSVVPATHEYAGPTETGTPIKLASGKSSLIRITGEASRVSIGNTDVADVTLINPHEVYVLAKKPGTTNLFVWARGGRTTMMDVTVGLDTESLRERLVDLVPSATGVKVASLGESIVLSGTVADAVKAHRLVSLAELHGGKKVVNLLVVEGSQQVMLEVKVAEVSKTLLDNLGINLSLVRSVGNSNISVLSQLLAGGASAVRFQSASGKTDFTLDAETRNGLVKILAEPTIMATSGQEGAFLAGGKVLIPVAQASGTLGATTITLEEKEFGVGLRFVPTLLEDGQINLRVTPEVSELSQVGTPVRTGSVTSVLPTITTRRASTTVQLRDGESFAIGGLIKNNVNQAIKAFPVLGEVPVLGALFRSSEFQTDRSELLFVVTPRIVKPLPPDYMLPTDNYSQPSRVDYLVNGRLEGNAPAKPGTAAPAGGFQMK